MKEQLLELLQQNARLTNAELAVMLGVTTMFFAVIDNFIHTSLLYT